MWPPMPPTWFAGAGISKKGCRVGSYGMVIWCGGGPGALWHNRACSKQVVPRQDGFPTASHSCIWIQLGDGFHQGSEASRCSYVRPPKLKFSGAGKRHRKTTPQNPTRPLHPSRGGLLSALYAWCSSRLKFRRCNPCIKLQSIPKMTPIIPAREQPHS